MNECTYPCSSEREDYHFEVCIKYSHDCMHVLTTFPIEKCCEYDEAENSKMAISNSQVDNIVHANDDRISNLEENYGEIQAEITTTKSLINQGCADTSGGV